MNEYNSGTLFYPKTEKSHNFKLKKFLQSRFDEIGIDQIIVNRKDSIVSSVSSQELDFFIVIQAFDHMYTHSINMANKGLEAMGFLVGQLYQFNKKLYSVIYDVVTCDLEATSISVRFNRENLKELFCNLDELTYDYVILGWYHSHPGFSSFMSEVDINTQKRMLNKEYHTAIVIDPFKKEVKSFRIKDESCIEVPYAIVKN